MKYGQPETESFPEHERLEGPLHNAELNYENEAAFFSYEWPVRHKVSTHLSLTAGFTSSIPRETRL